MFESRKSTFAATNGESADDASTGHAGNDDGDGDCGLVSYIMSCGTHDEKGSGSGIVPGTPRGGR